MRISATTFQNAVGKYLKLAMDGEGIIITKNGRAVGKLTGYEDPLIYVMKDGSAQYYVRRRATYEEFLEITEKSELRYELIDGEIYLMASPKHKHQVAVREIFGQLYNWFQDKPCSPLTSPFDVKLSNDSPNFEDDPNVVQPDILVMCDEETIDENDTYQGVPALVVEILSPSTRSKDMVKKLNLYMNSGVGEYWVVDTDNKQVQVYLFEDKEILRMYTVLFGESIKSKFFKGLTVETDKI